MNQKATRATTKYFLCSWVMQFLYHRRGQLMIRLIIIIRRWLLLRIIGVSGIWVWVMRVRRLSFECCVDEKDCMLLSLISSRASWIEPKRNGVFDNFENQCMAEALPYSLNLLEKCFLTVEEARFERLWLHNSHGKVIFFCK